MKYLKEILANKKKEIKNLQKNYRNFLSLENLKLSFENPKLNFEKLRLSPEEPKLSLEKLSLSSEKLILNSEKAILNSKDPKLNSEKPKADDLISKLKNSKKDLFIIAEIKKSSPSKGVLKESLDLREIIKAYNAFSDVVCAISVITETLYFKGSPFFIPEVKKYAISPILRKDFIFNKIQVLESFLLGADFILLIATLLSEKRLKELFDFACSLGLGVLVETHNKADFDKAFNVGAEFIGINNRNLKTMKVDIKNTQEILNYALQKFGKKKLDEKILVCESGIDSVDTMANFKKLGINVFLIGTHFMQSKDLISTLEEIRSEIRTHLTHLI